MPLVDYGSSSDEEEEEEEEEGIREDNNVEEVEVQKNPGPPLSPPPPIPPPSLQIRNFETSSHQQSNVASASSTLMEKLPDASVLLSSPSFSSPQMSSSDHSSRVAAAIAESASRKREANGSAFSYSRSKLPRGNLPHARNLPDTMGGMLVPPQISGRSNVVTEDISKLFVSRGQSESSQ